MQRIRGTVGKLIFISSACTLLSANNSLPSVSRSDVRALLSSLIHVFTSPLVAQRDWHFTLMGVNNVEKVVARYKEE